MIDNDSDSEDLDACIDSVFIPEIDKKSNEDPYPTIDKKREILNYFRSLKKSSKDDKLRKVKHKWNKVSSLRLLYKWEEQLKHGKYLNNFIECNSIDYYQ